MTISRRLQSRVANAFIEREAKEFATDRALKKYLHDHPKADPSQHSVKKKPSSGAAPAAEKPKGDAAVESVLKGLSTGERKRILEQALEIGDAKEKGRAPKVLKDLSKEKGFEVLKGMSPSEQKAVIEKALGKK